MDRGGRTKYASGLLEICIDNHLQNYLDDPGKPKRT